MLGVDYDAATNLLNGTFAPKVGVGDAQYQGVAGALLDSVTGSAGHFIPALTDAGNFGVGWCLGQGANSASNGTFTSLDQLLQTFGAANQSLSRVNTSVPFGNSPWGFDAIVQGYNATNNQLSSTSLDPNDLTPAIDRRSSTSFDPNDLTPWTVAMARTMEAFSTPARRRSIRLVSILRRSLANRIRASSAVQDAGCCRPKAQGGIFSFRWNDHNGNLP